MDPGSCGFIAAFSPMGPWAKSEYLALCLPLYAHSKVFRMYDLWYYCY